MLPRTGFLVVAALAAATLVGVGGIDARGDVPTGAPSFGDPLSIDNTFFPVSPGTIQVYLGRENGRRITVVVSHLLETREFVLDGNVVTCRVVQEHKFESGRLIAEQLSFFAQADDGAVWSFGETEDDDADDDDDEEDDDDDEDEPGGWVVGAVMPTDPIDTVSVTAPALVMPASPSDGDVWLSEDAGPGQTQQVSVRSTKATARIRGARFRSSVRVKETVPGERAGETKWYAPGVGFVRERGDGVRMRLNASTLGGSRR